MMQAPWPSPRQRGYVDMLGRYHPQVFAVWKTRLERALEHKQLAPRTEHVLVAAVRSACHFASPIIEHHLNEALNAGSNVAELLEAMLRVGDQEGTHAFSSGGSALWNVVKEREAAGLPTPRRGPPLTAAELIPHSPWKPATFFYQQNWPRLWAKALAEMDPERAAIDERAKAERAKLPRQLSTRMKELTDVAVNVAVCWPPRGHHVHESLNAGSNVQELVEVIMVCAEAAQGARETYVAGRLVEGGVHLMRHSLAMLDDVVKERDAAGVSTARDYGR